MLPFLDKQKRVAGLITTYRAPDETSEKSESNQALEACAEDIMSAFKADDKRMAAKALKALFEILESAPHEEAEHESEE